MPYRGAGTGIQRIIRACKEAEIRVEFINDEEGEQFKVVFTGKGHILYNL